MKKSKFTESQIAFVLKQVEEGTSIAEVCRKAGISEEEATASELKAVLKIVEGVRWTMEREKKPPKVLRPRGCHPRKMPSRNQSSFDDPGL